MYETTPSDQEPDETSSFIFKSSSPYDSASQNVLKAGHKKQTKNNRFNYPNGAEI